VKVSPETIMECAQLVKANSIEGCKKKEVYVVYTRWRNLHKTSDMEVGKSIHKLITMYFIEQNDDRGNWISRQEQSEENESRKGQCYCECLKSNKNGKITTE
jgi:hypothetical protein